MEKIEISKDGDWYLAEIKWIKNIYAYWNTKEEAMKELLWVLEMMMDYHLELVEKNRKLKNKVLSYAI
jgi:predicted RNase H-like HicB family nuclease